jgi:hypothetical protein
MKVVFVVSLFIKHPFEVVSWHYVGFPLYLPKVTVEVKAIASRFFRKSLIAKYVGTVWACYPNNLHEIGETPATGVGSIAHVIDLVSVVQWEDKRISQPKKR